METEVTGEMCDGPRRISAAAAGNVPRRCLPAEMARFEIRKGSTMAGSLS